MSAIASARSHVSLTAPAKLEADPEAVVNVTGKVADAPPGSHVALQAWPLLRWSTLASAPVRAGRFRLSWRAPIVGGPHELRLAVLNRGGLLLAAERVNFTLREAPFACEYPLLVTTPPLAPPEKGTVIGEIVTGGSAAKEACGTGRPRTVSVEDATGALIAQSTIAGRQSFDFILPPESYTLFSGPEEECRGAAVVAESRITRANIACPVR